MRTQFLPRHEGGVSLRRQNETMTVNQSNLAIFENDMFDAIGKKITSGYKSWSRLSMLAESDDLHLTASNRFAATRGAPYIALAVYKRMISEESPVKYPNGYYLPIIYSLFYDLLPRKPPRLSWWMNWRPRLM
jgi:hypothetical protein